MIGLIRKDFYLNRKTIFAFSAMAFGYAVLMIIASFLIHAMEIPVAITVNIKFFSMTNTLLFFLCATSVQSIMAQTDLGKKTRYYFCASPVCIKGLVASKYYESFLIDFFVFLYCEIFDLILSSIYGTFLNSSLIHVALLFMLMVIQSIALPFIIGFGKHGQHIKTGILIFFFACAAVYGLFGDISFFMQEKGVIALLQNAMAHVDTESIMNWILGAAYPLLICTLLLPHLVILLIYVSYRVSCALFRRGATTYEV